MKQISLSKRKTLEATPNFASIFRELVRRPCRSNRELGVRHCIVLLNNDQVACAGLSDKDNPLARRASYSLIRAFDRITFAARRM